MTKQDHADPTVEHFLRTRSSQCAWRVFTVPQIAYYIALAVAVIILVLYDWLYALTLINFLVACFYFSVIAYKCLVVLLSVFRKREIVVTRSQIASLDENKLPVYTILVPLYKEPAVADKIIRHIELLDYPKHKLDVKLLLEENDTDTIAAVNSLDLPPRYSVMVIPHSLPKTKPKACNHGLYAAKGEFLVIYDAEDRPEPDQLKKAVYAFKKQGQKVACLQGKLNYFNPYQNTLTRWFTIEYTAWFDLYLPGLHALGVPIPLGGTTNHFRTEILRSLGGWDPFNVTEDCDLGIRIHAEGYTTKVLDTTTWEEANSRLGNWIRQRSRWVKGYAQTHLVHMRNPFKLLYRLGVKNFVSFLLTVGGLPMMLLLNPIYWVIGLVYLSLMSIDYLSGHMGDEMLAWKMLYTSPQDDPFWSSVSVIFFVVTWVLVSANLLFVFINVLACRQRSLDHLIPLAFLSPIYWIFISIAAWKGFIQLFTNPFYWEKTVHGLADAHDPHKDEFAIEPPVFADEPVVPELIESPDLYETPPPPPVVEPSFSPPPEGEVLKPDFYIVDGQIHFVGGRIPDEEEPEEQRES